MAYLPRSLSRYIILRPSLLFVTYLFLPRDFIDAGEIRTTVYLDAEFRLSR